MDLTGRLALVSNLEPFVDTVVDAEGGELDGGDTDNVVAANILVVHLDRQIITDVLDINVEGLVPDGGLASSVLDVSLEVLLARNDLYVGVHLSEGLHVAC